MANGRIITVTHINVRQSISFLILKLLAIELIAAVLILAYYVPISQSNTVFNLFEIPLSFNIILFVLLVLSKMYFSFLVIFQWLNEYYEISPTKIVHRNGLIFRHEDHYVFIHISSVNLEQNLFGRILNYGTIALYDRFDKKMKYLYLIHNPIKHFHIIESLLPQLDESQHKIREHIFENEDEKL